jgi:hypothetical protein
MIPPVSFAFVRLRLPATYARTALSPPKSETWFMLGLSMLPQDITPGLHPTLKDWCEAMLVGADKKTKRSLSERLLYVLSNERNRKNSRVFAWHTLRWLTLHMRTFVSKPWLSV